MKIGFFDSGRGGTTVLRAVRRVLPEVEYKYIADSENCPYGEKSDTELMRIVREHVETLRDWGAEVIVIACNTATTRCIERLRREYPKLKFVGTEPAIKLAVGSGAKKILVMATPGTVESERTMRLLEENKREGQEVRLLACAGLADAIEAAKARYENENEAVRRKVAELLERVDRDFEVVVLGCTHYSLIKGILRKYFPRAELVDGNEGVARRVRKIARAGE